MLPSSAMFTADPLPLLSETKSDFILIEAFKTLDQLHTLKIAFNYLLINYFSLDQQASHPSLTA